jgi:hypothetical protein
MIIIHEKTMARQAEIPSKLGGQMKKSSIHAQFFPINDIYSL